MNKDRALELLAVLYRTRKLARKDSMSKGELLQFSSITEADEWRGAWAEVRELFADSIPSAQTTNPQPKEKHHG